MSIRKSILTWPTLPSTPLVGANPLLSRYISHDAAIWQPQVVYRARPASDLVSRLSLQNTESSLTSTGRATGNCMVQRMTRQQTKTIDSFWQWVASRKAHDDPRRDFTRSTRDLENRADLGHCPCQTVATVLTNDAPNRTEEFALDAFLDSHPPESTTGT